MALPICIVTAAALLRSPPHRLVHPRMQLSSGLTFEDDDGRQLLISAQKPLGMMLEECMDGNGCAVAALHQAGSAAKAGVREGDVLLAVQNADVTKASFEQVMTAITAAPRVVNLRFARRSAPPSMTTVSIRSAARIETLATALSPTADGNILFYLPDVDLSGATIQRQLATLRRTVEWKDEP